MVKIKILIFLCIISLNLKSQETLTKAIENKYACLQKCPRNVCTANVLCAIYSNQNMCLLQRQIPVELKNLSYVIYPTQVDVYNTARFNFNKLFNIFPHAIIIPQNSTQLAYALSILKKYNLNFSIRSGGHCFEPGSLSSGYIIDLRNFNNIIANISKEEVFIGAGCLLGEVIQTLGNINFAIPTGTCPGVGVTGLALGGGIGLLFRKFGLTSDSIKSILLLNSNSELIEVTATNKYSDLFWALSGAGNGSYGIVIGFTFKMYYIPKATSLKLTFSWDSSNIIEIVNAWQNWIADLSNDISTELAFISENGTNKITVRAIKANGQSFNEWKKPFIKFNPKVKIITGTYLDCAKENASLYTQSFVKAKSKFTFTKISDQAIQTMIDFYNGLEQNKIPLMLLILGACGGNSKNGDSAYFPRNAFAYMFQFAYWNYQHQSAKAISAITDIYNQLTPYFSPYSYSNLVDYDLGNNYLNAYYGTNVNRLIRIKNQYDPLNIFQWKQSIPLKI